MSISRRRRVCRVIWDKYLLAPASVSPAVKPGSDTWLCRERCGFSAGYHYLILMHFHLFFSTKTEMVRSPPSTISFLGWRAAA